MPNFTLPYPPSLNSLYKISSKPFPHIYLSKHGKSYKTQVLQQLATQNLQLRANIPLSLTLTITPPDNRTRDLDNLFKILFDSLTHAQFWEDDKLVRELHVSYLPVQKPGSLLLEVEALEPI